MRKEKEQALKLRLSGKSYTEIQRVLGTPKSTLSGWLSNLQISENLRRKIMSRAREKSTAALIRRNKNQTLLALKRRSEVMETARRQIAVPSKENLWFMGLALYWAEGYKRAQTRNGRELTSHAVSLTNSDPGIVKLFLRFIREVCQVPDGKIGADVRIYQHQNTAETVNFWSRLTKINKSKFGKVYYGVSKSSLGKRPYNRLPFGTIQIRVNSTQLFHQIMGWIKGLAEFV